MTDAELEPQLSILNPHPTRVPGPRLLHQLVQLTSNESLPAIHSLNSHGEESTLSYAQFHNAADALAARISRLAAISSSDDFIIPILIPQCSHLYIAMLAVLKAGGAFCPLHLDAPPERVRFILQDVSAKVVLVTRDLVSKIPQDDAERVVLVVDEEVTDDLASSPSLTTRHIEPQHLSYVMYTSGSTGTPKGVGVSHDAATQSLLAHDRHIPSFRRFLQFASPTFDVSVFEIFFPLLRGSTLVTCDRGRMLNDLPDVIRTLQVDACELTPTVAGSLLRSRQNAPCLKLLLTIGEMLTESVVREFGGSDVSDSMLWGMYGPTEAAIHCTLRPRYPTDCPSSNIGLPLDSVSCFVVAIPEEDSPFNFNILPIGELGELVVGGYQLANGYLNRPEQTDAAFFDTPHGRVYRTGDKAIMNSDGTMECLGRISDGQVKLRGQRIELGEVEQAAMRTTGCHSAIAMVLGGILVAFCAIDDELAPGDYVEDILNTCRTWLPSFMVPGDIVIKTGFPRLPSGKVDRKQLKNEYSTSLTTSQPEDHFEAASPLERKALSIVSNFLGSQISPSASLASVGLDSLKAIRLASALREGGFQASATNILSSKTLSALFTSLQVAASTSAIDQEGHMLDFKDPCEIHTDQLLGQRADLTSLKDDIARLQMCTPLQNSMLAETSVNPQAYCNWIKLEFPAETTAQEVLQWTYQVAQNNEILRSGFVSFDHRFAQIIYNKLPQSSIQIVHHLDENHSLASDESYLRPLRVQILGRQQGLGPIVLFQMHHALYDGWSADMLIKDFSTIADGGVPETRPQFRDVSRFYAEPATKCRMDEARGFWADHLLGWQRHNLPRLMGRPADAVETRTAVKTMNISQSVLMETASRLQCHPQVFFQAATLWLWAGLQGQTDLVIGSVSSGRTVPVTSIECIMGPCIMTTPLRVNLAGTATIADLVRHIQATNRGALQHGILPLADIKRIAGVSPGDALFDALFVYQESLYSQQAKQGHVREMSHQDFLETNLLIEIEPSAESPVCRLTYHTNAFTAEHAEILMKQLESVVSHLILEPQSPVETIGKSLSQGLTSIFNAHPVTLSTIPDLAAMFELSASATPGATAIRFARSLDDGDVDTMTYSSLNSSANKIARHLRKLGASEGSIVGIIMEKSISLYAAILGILKAGYAYLPLLPTTPNDRIRLILTQAEVSICVADAAVSSSLGDLSSCQFVDALSIDTPSTMENNLGLSVDPSRPAYVIYTSGTTGTPKGVVVTQKNIVSNLDVLSRIYPHSNTSRFLQACSQAFDVSVFEIFFTWKVGACLCSGTNDTLFEDLERAIQFLGCTHLSMTPTVASLVNPRNVPAVDFLVTAGEPMTALVAERWTGFLYQGYGPAETTNICTVKKMKPGDFIDHLGFSFDNTSTFVLGSTVTDPVPIGCVGELCFGGDQVAAGYLGMKNLTELKFLDHPQFGRIYRSGDMGRMLPDGSLMVLGRMDDQLKLRGQRIDTGEISSILTTSSIATSSAVVIVSNATTSTSQLAVFYVPAQQSYDDFGILPIDEGLFEANNTLLGLLRSRLPIYMIPSYLVPINSVPLTSSGKVDRARLQASFRDLSRDYIDRAAGSLQQKEDESFWSEDERTVRTAVSRTTNVAAEDIARWQPFAALGLDSISAISLARALQASFNRRVPVSTILRTGCIARLAQEILADTSTTSTSTAFCASALFPREFVEEVKRGFAEDDKSVSSVLPCTPLQEAMLLSTTGSSYSNQMVFRLHVSDTDMKSYWEQMHCRHGILRTCFVSTRDPKRAVAQVVLDSVSMAWDLIEAGSLEEAASQHVEGLPDPVDSKIPPLSLAILKVVGDVYLSFACHHALYDGVAMDALLVEVEQLAAGKTLPAPLEYEPILAEILQSPDGTSSFWKNHFDGFKPAQHILSAGGSQLFGSPAPIVTTRPLLMSLSQIQAMCKASGVSMLSYFQTAWSVFLTLVYGESEVCFGNVMSGRALSVDDIDRLVAPCFNTLPVRVEVPPSTESMALLKKFQNINPLLLEHQFTPLRSIQNQVSKSGIQLFDSLLLLQQRRPDRDSGIWELVEDNGTMDVPLVCELVPSPARDLMTVRLHSNSPFMAQEATVGLLDTFLHVAQHIATHPASSVPTRDHLAPETRQALGRLKIETISETIEQSDAEAASVTEEWSQAEDQLRSIISELSKVPVSSIRKTTTIFQLGLDSINAVQLAAMMRKQGLGLSALDVIESPTCAKLAICLRSAATQDTSQYDFAKFEQAVRDSSSAGDFDKILPCSPLQSGMLNDFIQSEGKAYLNYMSFALNEDISMDRVEDAWAALLDHHEILRTGFISTQLRDASFAMVQKPATRSQLRLTIHNHASDSFGVTKWKLDTAHTILSSLQQSPWALALESTTSGITMHVIMHHALYDAYSFQLILQDLSSFLSGTPMFQHAPIENGLSQILQASLDTSQAEAFWKQKAPEVVVNRFPTLTPLTEKSPASIVEKRVSSMDFTQLSENARRVGVSIQGVLQATWTRILSAYLGEEDVVFGIVLSGRMSDETRNVILPCITTLPVVAHNRSSNSELVQQMLDYNNQLLKHQNAPLAQVQRWLGYPNARVFDTLLVYQRMPTDDTPNFPWEVVSDEGNLDYPVSFEVEPLPDGKVQLRLSFKTDILPKAQAIHLLDQFDAVLRHLVQCPEQTTDDLWASDPSIFSITPPLEPTIHSEEPFLHSFVETKAETHPDKIALEFVTGFDGETPISRQWSFRELNEKGNQVAHVLSPHAKVGETIAIHFDKCPEACFVILGILKSGCAFLALDPSAPKARKEFILKDSGALALLTNVDIDFTVEQPIIHIDDTSLSHQPQQFIAPEGLSVQDNSYCLYTSGTTGTPKGCEITHENAVQAMKAFRRLFDGHWDEKSKWMQFASFHFDVSVLEQYWSWSVGMTLVGAPRDLILDDLAGTIRRLNITHIDLTPSLARLLDPAEVPSLSRGNGVFITGGEALKQEILDVWGPTGVIYNAYGPTEATIGVTMYQRVPQNGRASNIGKQFDNVGSYVLHPSTDIPVMKGGVGELCVSGKLVGKGYLKRPELTQERFPFLERHGERVYRTGDLVRVLHDGCFDFLGRADDQVKLRGQRLEIGEINHSIRTRVREVSDVATLVTKHGSLDKDLLVTFFSCTSKGASKDELQVLSEENTGPLVRSVQKACRDTLPGYMVPSYIFHVPRIPLSPNNKADIKQLNQLFRTLTPEKLVQLSPSSSAASEPINDTQRLVLSTMREFLGENTNVSLSSNIFDLGVDSISALRLSRLMRKGGLAGASPHIILRNPGLGDLAETLQESQSSNESSSVQEARQLIHAFGHRYRSLAVQELGLTNDRDIEYVAPCTPLQEGMLSRFMSDQDEGAYFTAFRLKLAPAVSIAKLKNACDNMVKAHAILRTSFIQTPAGFAQVAVKSAQLSWKDFRDRSPAEIEPLLSSALPDLIHQNSRSVSNPLELIVAQIGEETVLVVHIFHALYDGSSFESMLRWVSAEYLNKEHEAPPTFLDTLAHGPLANYDSSRQFWVDHLSDCSFDTLPRLRSGDPAAIITKTKTYSARNLETLRRSLNVTLQSVVLALWTSAFKKHFPGNAATGVIVSGRSIDMEQVENTIGPLFNTLLFYAGLKEGDTWLSLIQKCHEFNTSVLQFQHVPLRNIQKWCSKSRGRPIFENLFVFQIEAPRSTEPSGMWSIMDDYSVSDYPLAFEASATSDGQLRVQVVAHRDVADEATMNSLFEEIDDAMVDVTSRATFSLPVTANPSREASTAASPRTPLTSRPESIDGEISKDYHLELSLSDFEWTPSALALRKEIAALAGASEDSITENMALLQLGLDSIDLVKLSARLKHSGYELTLSQLMRAQTIAAMSQILSNKKATSAEVDHQLGFDELKNQLWKAVESTQFNLDDAEAVLPPTPLQESMMAEMLQSDFDQYFNHDILELADGLDLEKFERAWKRTVEHSPILRTVFVQIEDPKVEQTFAQIVLKSNLPTLGKFGNDQTGPQDIIQSHKENAQAANGHGNLLQLSLLSTSSKSLLILSISHALYDGWSLALLHQDVAVAYQSQLVERPPTEPFLRDLVKTPTDQSRKFWSQYLADTQPSLISERQSADELSRNVTHRTEAVSSINQEQVIAFCKRHAVSLQVLGQACWASVVATLLQSLEVTFGVVLAGRDSEQSQALMFPTMNTVAVRCFLHGSTTSFLRYLQETMGDITEFQNYPLRKAQSAVGGRLFNTLFILQKSPSSGPDNVQIMKSVQGSSATDFAVCAELETTPDTLVWRIAGQDAYVSERMTDQLLRQLDRALRFIINTPDDNLLCFEGDQVSICQLPKFHAKATATLPSGTAPITRPGVNDVEWTTNESTIRRVLSRAADVEVESIGKSHTLYNLGLDSISAIKVTALLRKEGINLGIRALLTSSSIKEMAGQAQATPTNLDVSPETQDIAPRYKLPTSINTQVLLSNSGLSECCIEEILPPLPMQVNMVSAWQNARGRVFYPDFFYRLKGPVNIDQLQSAWVALVDSEPILRTCLVATGERSLPFVQIILQTDLDGPHKRVVIDGQGPTPTTEQCYPQVQLNAKQEDAESWALKLRIHHSLYDGFSLPALMQKLQALIQSKASDKAVDLGPWRAFLASNHAKEVKDNDKIFWCKYLDGVNRTLSESHEDSSGPLSRVSLLKHSVVPEIGRLQACSAQAGVGLPALFFAATARALQKFRSQGTREIVFGIYFANRSSTEALANTFPTLNLVPLKVSLIDDLDLLQTAKQVQDDLHHISSHATVGLWEIKEWTGLEIDCFVNFLHLGEESSEMSEASSISLESISSDSSPSDIFTDSSDGSEGDCSARWLQNNVVRDAFPDALDVEASINAGGMDIGVFGASTMVSESTADDLIGLLGSILKGL